jgi:hypothetical protein
VCFKKTEEKINVFLKHSKTKLHAYLANKTESEGKDISTGSDSDSAPAEYSCVTQELLNKASLSK